MTPDIDQLRKLLAAWQAELDDNTFTKESAAKLNVAATSLLEGVDDYLPDLLDRYERMERAIVRYCDQNKITETVRINGGRVWKSEEIELASILRDHALLTPKDTNNE